jgi:hypothetical protein
VVDVPGGKRREGRFLSDLAAAYGAGVLDRPYDEQVALWLNLPRVQLRRAAAHLLGVRAAKGAELGPEWAEALTATDEEAAELHFQQQRAAREAEVLRRAGF